MKYQEFFLQNFQYTLLRMVQGFLYDGWMLGSKELEFVCKISFWIAWLIIVCDMQEKWLNNILTLLSASAC